MLLGYPSPLEDPGNEQLLEIRILLILSPAHSMHSIHSNEVKDVELRLKFKNLQRKGHGSITPLTNIYDFACKFETLPCHGHGKLLTMRWKRKCLTNIMQNSLILGIKLVGPYVRI